MHRPSTRLNSRRYWAGSAGWALLTAKAIASAFQYDTKAMIADTTSANTVRAMPLPTTRPAATPTSTRKSTKTAISAALRRLLLAICSYIRTERRGSELDLRRVPRRFVRFEVLPRAELHALGQEVAGELLDGLVVPQHGVVVELPRVGDTVLGGRQLLLQGQEVLVGLQVG